MIVCVRVITSGGGYGLVIISKSRVIHLMIVSS